VLNQYAPLYQDRLPFEIRDGTVELRVNYHLELNSTRRILTVTNTAFALRNFKLAEPGHDTNLVELALLAVTDVSASAVAGVNTNTVALQAEIGCVYAEGGRLFLLRSGSNPAVSPVSAVSPAATSTNAPAGIPALLESLTNAVALLLHTTNLCTATGHDVEFTNCAFHLEDLTASRPARLDLDNLALSIKNISNLPVTNLTVGLSLRWNTNGAIKTDVAVSLAPLTADVRFALDRLDLGTLDPYLESRLNLYIPDSQFNLHGQIQLRTPEGRQPEISFRGDTSLDNFRTVDGVLGEDLLKWSSVRVSGIEANLDPLSAAIREIALDNVSVRLVIETNHTINLLAALSPPGAGAPVDTNAPAVTNATKAVTVTAAKPAGPATNATASAALPPVSIGAIVISNAAASYTDRSITPNVHLQILEAGGTIAGLSSSQLQHADINLSAKVDGVGPVTIAGTLNPFSGTETNDIKITVKDVDLTPTSPYSGKFAGYRITQGKLNLDLAYDLVGRKLKSKNVITLDRFTFGEKVNSPDATHLPVRLAIAILKDRKGQILLDVPVEGSLDDPQFRIGKVVTHTLLNILTKVATSPFSLLGAAFGGGGEELGYQDFAPGSTALLPANAQKLDSLSKGLYERPGLQLEIAGSIDSEADRDGLRRASLDKQIRTLQWQSLGKSERAATTPDQLTPTPAEHTAWVKKLYGEAVGKGVINHAFIAANTNLTAIASQIKPTATGTEKGATQLMQSLPATTPKSSNAATTATHQTKTIVSADPKEALLLASIPVSDSDLETLAANRAKTVRAYILQTGKVEVERLFITENQTGGVRSDGSRVYLQFR
jgi:hypothetical protein